MDSVCALLVKWEMLSLGLDASLEFTRQIHVIFSKHDWKVWNCSQFLIHDSFVNSPLAHSYVSSGCVRERTSPWMQVDISLSSAQGAHLSLPCGLAGPVHMLWKNHMSSLGWSRDTCLQHLLLHPILDFTYNLSSQAKYMLILYLTNNNVNIRNYRNYSWYSASEGNLKEMHTLSVEMNIVCKTGLCVKQNMGLYGYCLHAQLNVEVWKHLF